MPSPGQSQLATDLECSFLFPPHGIFTFSSTTPFMQKLSTGLDNGWTCASPTTPSTFLTEITSIFAGYATVGAPGDLWVKCIATALDAEVTDWVNSWTGVIHSYTVNATSIKTRIDTCAPFSTSAAIALRDSVADTFVLYFGQETG